MAFTFIVLEGIDGSGKTTAALLLTEKLKQNGIRSTYIREPGGTKEGELLRSIILNPIYSFSPNTIALLFEAARRELYDKTIKPLLHTNTVVICDRFTISTLVYQGLESEYSEDELNTLNSLATNDLKPDLIFLLDGDPEVFLRRRQQRNEQDRYEAKDISFQHKLRKLYRQYIEKSELKTFIIDAEQEAPAIADNIADIIIKYHNH